MRYTLPSVLVGAAVPQLVLHVTPWAWLIIPAYLLFVARHALRAYIRLAWLLHRTQLLCPACQQRITPHDMANDIECGDMVVFMHDACLSTPVLRELRLAKYTNNPAAFSAVLDTLKDKTGKSPLGYRIVP